MPHPGDTPGTAPPRYVVLDQSSGSVLEEVEANMAFYEVYDGAVYLHQGRSYLCSRLDLANKVGGGGWDGGV